MGEVHNMTDKKEIETLGEKQNEQKLSNYGSDIKRENSKINVSQRDILPANTYVRVLLNTGESTFAKSYKPIFSEEIFVVDTVINSTPTLYTLKDLLDEPISGVIYRNEIKQTALPEKYLIEKILKTKTCSKTKKKYILLSTRVTQRNFLNGCPL